jgi:putative endonuclease
MEKRGYVYIMANWTGDVIYVGVTSDLQKRVYQHKHKLIKGFSSRYNLSKLVYFEQYDRIDTAILREKEIKAWRREKKNKLIVQLNSVWKDLAEGWFEDSSLPMAGSE